MFQSSVVTTATSIISCCGKTQNGLILWYQLTQIVLGMAVKEVVVVVVDVVVTEEARNVQKISFNTVHTVDSLFECSDMPICEVGFFLPHSSIFGRILSRSLIPVMPLVDNVNRTLVCCHILPYLFTLNLHLMMWHSTGELEPTSIVCQFVCSTVGHHLCCRRNDLGIVREVDATKKDTAKNFRYGLCVFSAILRH